MSIRCTLFVLLFLIVVSYNKVMGVCNMAIYNLDTRCKYILNMLLQAPSYVSIQDIKNIKNISRRSVYYDLNKVNEWLETIHIDPIEVERNKGILISEEKRYQIKQELQTINHMNNYVFSPMERVSIIICTVLMRTKVLYIEDFMEVVQVSRNTIINDLKIVSKKMSDYGLTFTYETKRGYHISGDERNKRMVFFLYFNEVSEYYQKKIVPIEHEDIADSILVELYDIEKKLQNDYVRGICFSVAIYFSTIDARTHSLEFSEEERKEIQETKAFQLVESHFPTMVESEQMYMALHLLGSRLQTLTPSEFSEDDEIYEITKSLIQEFSRIACIDFDETSDLEKALFQHLQTSIYRYRYGIQLGNPMLEDIKREYSDLFEITRKTCEYLEQLLSTPIPESEIAYITLHFGGFINAQSIEQKALSILIVCPNGVSTGNMLRQEVSTLIAGSNNIKVISLNEYDFNHTYDVVISTVDIIDKKHQILQVHPILSDNDRLMILKRCMNYESEREIALEEVLRIVSKYVDKAKLKKIEEELRIQFQTNKAHGFIRFNQIGIGLSGALNKERIHIHECKADWKKSIHIAGESLIKQGYIEEKYVESIIQSTLDLGPYMFITNEVVLAHSRVEDGVNRLGVSLTLFKEPILFENNKIARIIIVLAAEDQKKHMRILNDVMTIFKEQQNIDKLMVCETSEDIHYLINETLKKEEQNENE